MVCLKRKSYMKLHVRLPRYSAKADFSTQPYTDHRLSTTRTCNVDRPNYPLSCPLQLPQWLQCCELDPLILCTLEADSHPTRTIVGIYYDETRAASWHPLRRELSQKDPAIWQNGHCVHQRPPMAVCVLLQRPVSVIERRKPIHSAAGCNSMGPIRTEMQHVVPYVQ